jgi:uncharacterized RDD family membrane protein YckC
MTNTTDTLQIDTPENVTFDYDVAGIGSRFLAALVDTTLLLLLQIIVIGTLILIAGELNMFDSGQNTWLMAAFSLLAFIFLWGYYIFFEMLWNGQTPGKRWTGIRVIRVDGTPVSAAEVIIRNLVRIIDLLPAAYGVGVVTMFINSRSRRLGDLAAGTVVVHERSQADLVKSREQSLGALTTLNPYNPVPEGLPIERLTEGDLQLIEDFLLRRYHLPNREQLAVHILTAVYARLGYTAETSRREADDILASIYKTARSLRQPSA